MKTTMKLCKSSFGRFIAFILCFVMTFTFMPFIDSEGTTANADTQKPTIKLGEYVQMGTYYGEPILWRCVGFYKVEDDGITVDLTDTITEYQEGYLPLMLSDKILCQKAFDAPGDVTTGTDGTTSHGRGQYSTYRQQHGSNCWEDSNIRDWLNSKDQTVTWTCGNPPSKDKVSFNAYDTEPGFLKNFTQSEINCMKKVSQYQLLHKDDYTDMDSVIGNADHSYSSNVESCVSNFKDAYKKKITDTMFLLDVNQVHDVYMNSDILGVYYYRGKLTTKCVEYSDYEKKYFDDPVMVAGDYWDYWLRSPYTGDSHGYQVRYVDYSVNLGGVSCGYRGIRPAFYLDLSSETVVYGNGSEDNPYSLEAGPNVTVDFANEQTEQDIDNTILYKKSEETEWTHRSEGDGKLKLKPGETYYFTFATKASAVTAITLPGRPTHTPSAPTVESQTDTTVTLSANSEYEYKCDVVDGVEGNWQDSNVFKDLTAGKSYTFYQRVKATESAFCSDESDGQVVAIKFAAPTVSYRTLTSITLKPIEGYLYKCGDGGWQQSNVFENLKAGQSYTFYQKKNGAEDTYASEPLEVKTLTYGEAITSAVGITGVTAYLVAVAKNKLISKWFLTSNGIFGKKVNSWVKNLWTNMLH